MRVLVTGADGFVGRHLVRAFRAQGDEVCEVVGPKGDGRFSVDLTLAAPIDEVLAEMKPEAIVHLAGFSSVARSHQDPSLAFAVNAGGTVHLLSAAKRHTPGAKVLLVSSGEVYGALEPERRATESVPVRPLSPYAASKAAAEIAGLQFHRSYGMAVVCARSFNHLGAGQDANFVVPSFAAQLADIAAGANPVLKTGNLEPIRDFLHVEDVVDAYRLLIRSGTAGGVYNVSSGQGQSIRAVLDQLIALSGVPATVTTDPARVRPAEIMSLVGDSTLLRGLGWAPRRSVQDALRDVYNEVSRARPLQVG